MNFSIIKKDPKSGARTGIIKTAHGKFQTPAFMPVATKGAVKTIEPYELSQIGCEIILSNAYHLFLRPGIDIIKQHKGLHNFMGWNRPILTDSGGYQIFSQKDLCSIKHDGVKIKSFVDGMENYLTPQKVIEIQETLGSDIMMPLDLPAPYPANPEETSRLINTTLRWLGESIEHHKKLGSQNALFCITQGGFTRETREQFIEEYLGSGMETDGFAIGGLSLGEPKDKLFELLEITCKKLPENKPRYLMGVGTPEDIEKAISLGVDMFDCILPTRLGRNGWAFTSEGVIKIKNSGFKNDLVPVDQNCNCKICANYTRSYIRHLFNVEELLALKFLSYHNLYYYTDLIRRIREQITNNETKNIEYRR